MQSGFQRRRIHQYQLLLLDNALCYALKPNILFIVISKMSELFKHYTDPNALPATSPFSHLVTDDLYAYVAGRVAADIPEHEALLGDVYAETRHIMTSILVLLNEVNLDFSRVVQTTVHLVNLNDMPEMDRAYGAFFQKDKYPARTCIESAKLYGGSRVEITCTARH
jgi:2-iminobutanoate/2-iminopropanoate deaminase